MTNGTFTPPNDAGWYEIRVQGCLDPRWSTWLDGVHIRRAGDGSTVLLGHVIDQAALHGLLARVRDIGLPLIAVARVDPDPTDHTNHEPTGD